jgi:hypothetical protein
MKIFCPIYTVKGYFCDISKKCKSIALLSPIAKHVLHKLVDTDQEAQRNFVNWLLQKVGPPYAGEILPTLSLLAIKLVVISLYILLELSK